jgi:hypothetical protein
MRRWVSAFMVLFLGCMLILPVAAAEPGSDANPGSKDPQADDPSQPPPPPVQTVQVPTGSLVFGTPDGWTMDNSQNQLPILATVFGPNSGLRLQVMAYPQTSSLDDTVAAFKAGIGSNQWTITGDNLQDVTIGAEAAKVYTFVGTKQDGSPVSGNFTVLFHEGQEYDFITFANTAPLPNADSLGILLGSGGFLN